MNQSTHSQSLTQLKYFNFFMYGCWSLLVPFLPLYFEHTQLQSMQIGILMSLGPFISLLANPFWGFWSDRTQNPRLIIMILLIGNFIASQFYFHLTGFMIEFIITIAFFFFQTSLNPITNSLTLHAIENTSLQFGTFRLWGSLGFAVMVLAASPFIQMIGIQNIGYLYGGLAIIALTISFWLPNQAKQRKHTGIPRGEFAKLIKNKLFVTFLLLSILLSIPNRINSIFISVFIEHMGGQDVYVGWSWFVAAMLEVPIFLILDRYLRITERAMFGLMVIVSALYTLRWLLMGLAQSPLEVVFIQLLHSFTFGVTFYTGTQICDFLVPRSVRSTGQALYGLFWMGVSGAISGILGGYLNNRLGSEGMYIICAAMSGAATIGYLFIWRFFKLKENKDTMLKAKQSLNA